MIICSPSQSLILDLDDPNMAELFTTSELEELHNYGTPLLRDTPEEIRAIFKDFKNMVWCNGSKEVYAY